MSVKLKRISRTRIPSIKREKYQSSHEVKFFNKIQNSINLLTNETNSVKKESPVKTQLSPNKMMVHQQKSQIKIELVVERNKKIRQDKNGNQRKEIQIIQSCKLGNSNPMDILWQKEQQQMLKQNIFQNLQEEDLDENSSLQDYQVKSISIIQSKKEKEPKQQSYDLYHQQLLKKDIPYKEKCFKINHKIEWRL